ncbi:MAG: hypothetical protein M1831_005678 [Alyxoria varia]|nr:MAG: hypothetical protein M1831_005678 [Alyxoria varia]
MVDEPRVGTRSLYEMAKATLRRNVKYIEGVGAVDYKHVRDIIALVENPDQLHCIETNSPEIIGHDADVWRKMMVRYIRSYMDNPVQPDDGKDWYGLYLHLKKKQDKQDAASRAKLQARLNQHKAVKDEYTTTFDNNNLLDPVTAKNRDRTLKELHKRGGPSANFNQPSGRKGGANSGHRLLMKFKKEANDDARLRKHTPFQLDPAFGQKRKAPGIPADPTPAAASRVFRQPAGRTAAQTNVASRAAGAGGQPTANPTVTGRAFPPNQGSRPTGVRPQNPNYTGAAQARPTQSNPGCGAAFSTTSSQQAKGPPFKRTPLLKAAMRPPED